MLLNRSSQARRSARTPAKSSATIRHNRLLSARYRGVSRAILSRSYRFRPRLQSRMISPVISRWNCSPRQVPIANPWFFTRLPVQRSLPPYGSPNVSPWSWKAGNFSGKRERTPGQSGTFSSPCQPVSVTKRYTGAPNADAMSWAPRQMPSTRCRFFMDLRMSSFSSLRYGNSRSSFTLIEPPRKTRWVASVRGTAPVSQSRMYSKGILCSAKTCSRYPAGSVRSCWKIAIFMVPVQIPACLPDKGCRVYDASTAS